MDHTRRPSFPPPNIEVKPQPRSPAEFAEDYLRGGGVDVPRIRARGWDPSIPTLLVDRNLNSFSAASAPRTREVMRHYQGCLQLLSLNAVHIGGTTLAHMPDHLIGLVAASFPNWAVLTKDVRFGSQCVQRLDKIMGFPGIVPKIVLLRDLSAGQCLTTIEIAQVLIGHKDSIQAYAARPADDVWPPHLELKPTAAWLAAQPAMTPATPTAAIYRGR